MTVVSWHDLSNANEMWGVKAAVGRQGGWLVVATIPGSEGASGREPAISRKAKRAAQNWGEYLIFSKQRRVVSLAHPIIASSSFSRSNRWRTTRS